MCLDVLPACMSVHAPHAPLVLTEAGRGHWIPETGIRQLAVLCGYCKSNLHPLGEQPVRLAAKPLSSS